MRSRHHFPVGHMVGVDDALERVAENVSVIAVVEPPFQLLEVAVEMLCADLVESAHDGTLEERPDALNTVRMNIPYDPFLCGVVHCLVAGVVVLDTDVGLEFVGVDRLGLVPHGVGDKLVESFLPDVGDASETNLPAALDGTGNPRLVASVALAQATLLSTDQRFVYLNHTEERRAFEFVIAHRLSDAVAQIPCRPVGDIDCPLDLESGHSLLGLAHQVDRKEPFAERKVGVVHDGARGHCKLMLAGSALELVPHRKLEHVPIAATLAGNPIRPAQSLKGSEALFVGTELVNERE